jgi:hypothetical protein
MAFVTESAGVENTSSPTSTISNLSVSENTREADGSSTSPGKTSERTISIGRRPVKPSYSEAARKLIPSDGPGEEKPAPAAETKPAGDEKPAADTKPSEAPDPVAEHRKANERLTARNAELLRELTELKAAKPKKGASDREKLFDEIDREYIDNPPAALRKLVAHAIRDKDPKSERVTREIRNMYRDLTERELEVAPTEAARAEREMWRTRLMYERDKVDREAEAAAAAEEAKAAAEEAAKSADPETTGRVALVASLLPAVAEKAPLTLALAEHFDNEKPEALIYRFIRHGLETGAMDPGSTNEELVAAATMKIETHYRGLIEKIDAARNKTATSPTQADATKDSPSAGADRSSVVRTITGAHASVAPATPPATKPDDTKPVQYVSKRQKHLALAEKYAGSVRRG